MMKLVKISFSYVVISIISVISNLTDSSYINSYKQHSSFETREFTQIYLFWGWNILSKEIQSCKEDEVLSYLSIKTNWKQLVLIGLTGDIVHINTVEAHCLKLESLKS